MKDSQIALLADAGSIGLTKKIHRILSKKLNKDELYPFNPEDLYINRFKSKEVEVKVKACLKKKSVFVVKSFDVLPQKRWDKKPGKKLIFDPNTGYMELWLINDALKRTGVEEINNVMPFMAYQRQDKKDEPRVPISSKVYAKFTEASGAKSILTLDPHTKQIQGFYEITFNTLKTSVLFAEFLEREIPDIKNRAFVASADFGGVQRAKELADMHHLPLVVNYKMRSKPGEASVMGTMKMDDVNLDGKIAIFYDDIIDSGNSIIKGVDALKKFGVTDFYACCSHPVLSGEAKDKLVKEGIKVIATDSIRINNLKKYSNIKVVSASLLLAEAIYTIYKGEPISQNLYNYEGYKKLVEEDGIF